MFIPMEDDAAEAIFSSSRLDGRFLPGVEEYLTEVGQTRPSVVLAFAPKAAGTFLRTAAISAVGGQLTRMVQAQGGRDGQFYLPAFLLYYAGGFPARPLVTHVHMQALPANRHFIEAFDLKPVIMIRALPDMLVSYIDMLEDDCESSENWLNIQVPPGFRTMSAEDKADFMIDMMGPWYASYFATWLEYAARDSRVLVLDYEEFRADPLPALEKIVAHSRFHVSREKCQAALDEVWEERRDFRYRHGISGRGRTRFSSAQIGRMHRMLNFYPELAPFTDRLIPPLSDVSTAACSSAVA